MLRLLLELGGCLGEVDCFCTASLDRGLASDCRDDDSPSSGRLLRPSLLSALAVLLFRLLSVRRVAGLVVGVSPLSLVVGVSLALFVCPLLVVFCGDVPLLLLAALGEKRREAAGRQHDSVALYVETHCPKATTHTFTRTLTFSRGSWWAIRFLLQLQFLGLRMALGLTMLSPALIGGSPLWFLLLLLIGRLSSSQF